MREFFSRPIDWYKALTEMYTRHVRATCEYEIFLGRRKRKALRDALNTYHQHIEENNLPFWFDKSWKFHKEETVQNMKQQAYRFIMEILSFAKE